VTIDEHRRIYVSDTLNHRVQVFEPDGTFVSQFGSFGTGEGQFGSLTEIQVGSDGSTYVLDGPPDRLSKFTADGKFAWRREARQLTSDGPGFLHGIAVRPDGAVLLRCEQCFYTMVIDPGDGQVRERIPTPGFEGSTLTLDPAGRMYAAHFAPQVQLVFDTTGHLVGSWYSRVISNLGNGHVEWGDTFWPSPVFLPDGRAFAFGKDGLLELKVTLPDPG
jgi:DNA-binding beta-propeller fold protein YncE